METTTDASDNWKIVEQNTKESFRLCKNDIGASFTSADTDRPSDATNDPA